MQTHAGAFSPHLTYTPDDVQEILILDVSGSKVDMKLPKTLPALPAYLDDLRGVDQDGIQDRWALTYSNAAGDMVLNEEFFDANTVWWLCLWEYRLREKDAAANGRGEGLGRVGG